PARPSDGTAWPSSLSFRRKRRAKHDAIRITVEGARSRRNGATTIRSGIAPVNANRSHSVQRRDIAGVTARSSCRGRKKARCYPRPVILRYLPLIGTAPLAFVILVAAFGVSMLVGLIFHEFCHALMAD